MLGTPVILLILAAGLCYAQHPMVATEERHLRNPGRNNRVIFPEWEPSNTFHNSPVFSEDRRPQRDSGQQHKSNAQLPDTLNLSDLSVSSLRMLGSMQNLSAIAEFFGLNPDPIEEPIFEAATSRGAHTEISLRGRSGATSEPEDAKMAACTPSLQTVEFAVPEHTLYLPPCVSLERCGGCCAGKDLLSCQPTQTTPVALKVIKIAKQQNMASSRAGRRRPGRQTTNYHIIHEEKHTACTCQCIIQEKDCDLSIHTYKATDCACVCKKKDEESKCKSNSATHDWNSKTCKCTCRRVRGCSTGEYFDHNTCRCIRNRSRNAYSASSGGTIIESIQSDSAKMTSVVSSNRPSSLVSSNGVSQMSSPTTTNVSEPEYITSVNVPPASPTLLKKTQAVKTDDKKTLDDNTLDLKSNSHSSSKAIKKTSVINHLLMCMLQNA